MAAIKHTKMHKEDKEMVIAFIDYVRVEKAKDTDYELELYVRKLAEWMNINSQVTNSKLATRFVTLMERGVIV